MTNLTRILSCLRSHRWPLAVLVLLPILANAVALSGVFNNDPTLQFIGLGTQLRAGLIPPPMSWVDPSVAYITQPLGHLVVSDWLHGIIPWWNPYSGVGMPLAAAMQSSVFFLPFIFLLHWDCGWLLLRLLVQICCGLFAYAFFVEIKLRREAGVLGGALYSLSALFLFSPNAPIIPLPFLPLLLLGIEYAARATLERKKLGWSLVTVAVAYSILGGFPEIAYLDGLFAAVWTLWLFSTLPPRLWARFIGKMGVALVIALCICAPLLIPFFEYLPHAYIGPHSGTIFMHLRLETVIIPLQIFPFLYGPLGIAPPPSLLADFGGGWIRLPCWVGLPVLTLAISALCRRSTWQQPRYLLLFWIILWEARYVGVAPVIWLLNLVPALATADIVRFSGPMLGFSVFTLAAFGLNDYLEHRALSLPRLAGMATVILVILVAAITPASGFLLSWWKLQPFHMLVGCIACLAAVLISLFLCWELHHPRFKYPLLALLLMGPLFALSYPQFAGFRGGKIDLAPVRFLQANAGTQRMISIGPLGLNFPVPYGIASINYAALPGPLDWTNYISANLFSNTDLIIYQDDAIDARTFLLQHLSSYGAVGVRYIVTRADNDLSAGPLPLTALQARNLPHVLLPNAGSFFDQKSQRYISYASLPNAGDLTGSIAVALSSPSVKSVSVILGTYVGSAKGILTLTLCTLSQCETASVDVASAKDNEPLEFVFTSPLNVPAGAELSYRFNHPDGTPVAVWLSPGLNQTEVPSFSFTSTDGTSDTGTLVSGLTLVFKDETASIFQLANALPYASATGTGCKLDIISRLEMHSSCIAEGSLLRREMYFPGWAATVNGTSVDILRSGIFQLVALPKGNADIRFTYAPPHSRLAFALALGAFVIWFALVWFCRPKAGRRSAHIQQI